ncbi:MAG: glycosyltransferase family 4 protein [Candidatus Orphnella occulta]|nr:glycosyltransferase family 4 protein [Candidatus Orphnella occulta]
MVKKKILLFNSGALLYGSEKGLLNIIKALSSDYEITVVLPEEGPLVNILRKSGIKVKIFPLAILSFSYSPLYYFKFFLFSIVDIIYFSLYVNQHNFDIIYTNNSLIIFPSFIAAFFKKTHIWHIREFFHIGLINRFLAHIIKKFSARIVCQSENIRKTLFPLEESKIKVIYEGLELALPNATSTQNIRTELNISSHTVVMSIVSRIHPHKGQYEFIRSMAAFLSQKDSNAVLLLAGDIAPRNLRTYIYKKKIEKIIQKYNLQKKVLLLGFVKDVRMIFESTDLAIFPIRRNEPFGIALLEALTFPCQVFVSPNPGFDEVISFFKTPYNKLRPKVLSDIIRNRGVVKREPDLPKAFLFKTYKNKMLILMREVLK